MLAESVLKYPRMISEASLQSTYPNYFVKNFVNRPQMSTKNFGHGSVFKPTLYLFLSVVDAGPLLFYLVPLSWNRI